uniref:Uncharacterized protein n=1 Tax=Tetranychus urticae TaxID=32264 RepID=T1KVW9_TETUR
MIRMPDPVSFLKLKSVFRSEGEKEKNWLKYCLKGSKFR